MSESAKSGQKSSTSHPPASKPVSLAPLKFQEAVTALSRVVAQHPGMRGKNGQPLRGAFTKGNPGPKLFTKE